MVLFLSTGGRNELHLGLFVDATTSGKESNRPKQAIQTIVVYDCGAECDKHRSKAKKLNIYAFRPDVTRVKWPKHLSVQRRWKALLRRERKEECRRAEPQKKFQAVFLSFRRDRH